MKKVLVSIPEGAWKVISEELRGKLGESDSELIRTILLCYASEHGYLHGKNRRART